MATPAATNPTHPSSASKKGHVSTPTPFGFSSPAPRSVPSPAATRKDHAGKTPLSHPTTGSSQGSKTLSGTPMVQNLSQQGHSFGSSPGAHMLGYGTPIGLGVEGATPSMLNMSTPMGGLAMATSLSELGLTTTLSGPKPSEDDQRKTRMRRVLKKIGTKTGRVSEDGIARVSRRVGFTNDIDVEQLSRDELERVGGNRKVAIAGNKVLVDVDLKLHVPQSVEVMYDTENAHLAAQAGAAGSLLLDDLHVSDAINSHLDQFAANLDRLARIDRLSSNHVNCFEALSGIHSSLDRLYRAQRETASELEVMTKLGGKPAMHANGRLGLALEYWSTDRQSLSNEAPDSMEVDSNDKDVRADGVDRFRLDIEVEKSLATLYPSLRVSDEWLPATLTPTMIGNGEGPPWQDPLPTTIGTSSTELDIMSGEKLPDLRFTAKLEPPIAMPWQVGSSIMQSCGLPGVQPSINCPTWHSMVLDRDLPITGSMANAAVIATTQTVTTLHDDKETEVLHSYRLDVPKPEIGVKLHQLPFAHPRQLIEALPTLRQWAQMSALIRQLFIAGDQDELDIMTSATAPEELLEPSSSKRRDIVPVSIALVTAPVPTLVVTFPSKAEEAILMYSVQVLPNGEYHIIDSTRLSEEMETSGGDASTAGDLAKALDISGELGVWVEWLRQR